MIIRNKKIDVVVKFFYPVKAGIQTNCLEIYSSMSKRGWNITVHTSKSTLNKENILPRKSRIRGVNIQRYKSYKYFFIPSLKWNSSEILALHNFNIFPHMPILIYTLVLKMTRKKNYQLILTPHGGFTPEWSVFSGWQSVIKKMYHYSLGTFLINSTVDKVRAVSDWEKNEMVKYGVNPNLINVISNGVEIEAFTNVEKLASTKKKTFVKKMQPYIIQLGRIHPVKNYEVAIKAMSKLSGDAKKINFIIVGPEQNTEYKSLLVKLIKDLALNNKIHFIGSVFGIDKYYLLRHAEMMVHLAKWEAYCNAVQEGMSQGLVCITSKHPALSSLVSHGINGFNLDINNYQSLARKIDFVFKNKNNAMIKNMRRANVKHAANRTWENISKEVEKYYVSPHSN